MEKNNGLQMLDDWGAAERNFNNEPNYFEKVVSEQNGNIMEGFPLENSGNGNQSIFEDIAGFKEETIINTINEYWQIELAELEV